MRRWNLTLILLLFAGLQVLPAYAEMRLKTTGYIDNHVRYIHNVSTNEEAGNGDLTLDDDDDFHGRTRGRLFMHISANDFSKAVIAFEYDQLWGANDSGQTNGFDFGIDNMVVELKQLYVDIKIPGTPIRFQMGGFPINGTRLTSCLVLCDDVGGLLVFTDISPQVKLYTWYIQHDEELISNVQQVGEDFSIGNSLRLTPVKGVDVDLFTAFYHLAAPGTDSSSIMIGSCSGGREGGAGLGNHCMVKENRFYIGIDSRLKFGAFTAWATFLYLTGQRDLTNGLEADLQTFLLHIKAAYSAGPITVTGRFVYVPGNEYTDKLDGTDGDIKFWQNITVTTVNRSVQWFELMGWNIDGTSPPKFGFNDSRTLRADATFDQFGLIHAALKGDFKAMKQLTLSLAVGLFWSAEDVGAPARFGVGAAPRTRNWTGDDNYLGTEIEFVTTFQWFKGTTVQLWVAYAIIGDAQDLCAPGTFPGAGCTGTNVIEAENQVGAGGRIIYRF